MKKSTLNSGKDASDRMSRGSYKEIYFKAFNYDTGDNTLFIPSEISEQRAVDIHHIIGRGKKGPDRIENLMALTRQEHTDYGDKTIFMAMLFKIHKERMIIAGIDFDSAWIDAQVAKYS